MRRAAVLLLPLVILAACNDPAGLPTTPQATPRVVAIATSFARACALTDESAVWCWDPAGFFGDTSSVPVAKPMPEALVTLKGAPGAAYDAFCGQTAAGTAWCWGKLTESDVAFYIGDGDTPMNFGPFQPGTLALGKGHACALAADSTAACWGSYISGKRGIPGPWPENNSGLATYQDLTVRPVTGGERFVALTAGAEHTCGTRPDGTLACWGDSAAVAAVLPHFSHGNDACFLVLACSADPLLVQRLNGVVAASAGDGQTCAVASNGLFCWGSNYFGQAGGPGSADVASPVPVPLGGTAVAVSAGLSHSCALVVGGDAWCWGNNEYGQTGSGEANLGPHSPVRVAFTGAFEQVSAGGFYTCGLSTEGRVYCWGAHAGSNGWEPQPEVREVRIPRVTQ